MNQHDKAIDYSLRDIVALSTLPAIWAGAAPQRIAESLAAALFTTLNPRFVYVVFAGGTGSASPISVAQTDRYETSPDLALIIGPGLWEWARTHDPDELYLMPDGCSAHVLRVTTRPLGAAAELGVIAAGFKEEEAPTPAQHLILNVSATQAAAAVQNAYLLRSLRESEDRLEEEIVGLQQLQEISSQISSADDDSVLYDQLLDAAVAIMRSDMALMQIVDSVEDGWRMAAWQGFDVEFANRLNLHRTDARTSCSVAWQPGTRVIVPDMENCEFIAESPALEIYRRAAIRAMQSTPLISRSGKLVGMVSTYWKVPYSPSERDLGRMDVLARQAADVIERAIAARALRESEARFRNMADHAPVVVWVCAADGTCTFLGKTWYDTTGQKPDEGLGSGWLIALHEEDRQNVRGHLEEAQRRQEAFRLEYRLRAHDESFRWVVHEARPRFGQHGEFVGYIGSLMDISDRKQAEETQQLLLNELNHRVKNTLSIVQAIAQQTFRSTSNPSRFVENFSGRLDALSRVHTLLTNAAWRGADLRKLIYDQVLLGPVNQDQVTAWGPSLTLDAQLSLRLALVLHELATNACKYGALSVPDGWVAVSWTVQEGEMNLQWVERGGPAVKAPASRGFGTRLIEQSIKSHKGDAQLTLEAQGISWAIRVPLPQDGPTAASSPILAPHPLTGSDKEGFPDVLKGKRVLVIEDEPLVAMEFAENLEALGIIVAGTAGSVEEALHAIENEVLHAAFLDGNLNGQPVDEIAAALIRRSVPFAFVSGYTREGLAKAFQNTPFLSKPLSAARLREAAAQLLDDRGTTRLRRTRGRDSA